MHIDRKNSGTLAVRLPLQYLHLIKARALAADRSVNDLAAEILKRELEYRNDEKNAGYPTE